MVICVWVTVSDSSTFTFLCNLCRPRRADIMRIVWFYCFIPQSEWLWMGNLSAYVWYPHTNISSQTELVAENIRFKISLCIRQSDTLQSGNGFEGVGVRGLSWSPFPDGKTSYSNGNNGMYCLSGAQGDDGAQRLLSACHILDFMCMCLCAQSVYGCVYWRVFLMCFVCSLSQSSREVRALARSYVAFGSRNIRTLTHITHNVNYFSFWNSLAAFLVKNTRTTRTPISIKHIVVEELRTI